MRRVVEQDAGLGGVRAQGIESGAKSEWIVGVGVGDAEDLEAVDDYLFIGQDADAVLGERLCEGRFTAVLRVIAGDKVDAVGRREIFEGSDEAGGIGMNAVKEVAGKEDDIGLEASREGYYASAETGAVDVAQVQVADQESRAAAPGAGKVGELDRYAANAHPAGIEQTVDAGEEGQGEEDAGDERAVLRQSRCERGKLEGQVGQPTEAGGEEEVVEESEPDGGDLVDETDRQAGKVIAEQGGGDETEDRKR